MARIQTISGTAVPSSPLGIKADVGAMTSGARANAQFAGALGQTAQVMAGIVAARQNHIDKGLLAKEDSIRSKTAAEIQTYMDNNQGTPESWQKFHDDTWKAYDDARNARAKEWSPQLKAADDIKSEDFRMESGIRFGVQQNKALISQANARLEANAADKMRNGDVSGALISINAMNLTPDKKAERVQQVTSAAAYHSYDMRLSNIDELPPAQALTELNNVEAELIATKDGQFQAGNVVD